MEKITKLATIVAKAARMEKKASNYKGKVAEMLNDINDPDPLIDYISESDAKKICEELDIPHEASWYKGDLRGYVEEIPDGMVDVLIEYISESDAESLWGMIANDMGIEAKKKSNLTKKASMDDIEIKIKQEKDYFMVYMGTAYSSGIKKKCKNTFEIVETLRNYVENRIMESK